MPEPRPPTTPVGVMFDVAAGWERRAKRAERALRDLVKTKEKLRDADGYRVAMDAAWDNAREIVEGR